MPEGIDVADRAGLSCAGKLSGRSAVIITAGRGYYSMNLVYAGRYDFFN